MPCASNSYIQEYFACIDACVNMVSMVIGYLLVYILSMRHCDGMCFDDIFYSTHEFDQYSICQGGNCDNTFLFKSKYTL